MGHDFITTSHFTFEIGFSFVDETLMGAIAGPVGSTNRITQQQGDVSSVFGSKGGIAMNMGSVGGMQLSSSLPRSGAGATMLATSLKKTGMMNQGR